MALGRKVLARGTKISTSKQLSRRGHGILNQQQNFKVCFLFFAHCFNFATKVEDQV
jgi:hypothetical protein